MDLYGWKFLHNINSKKTEKLQVYIVIPKQSLEIKWKKQFEGKWKADYVTASELEELIYKDNREAGNWCVWMRDY